MPSTFVKPKWMIRMIRANRLDNDAVEDVLLHVFDHLLRESRRMDDLL